MGWNLQIILLAYVWFPKIHEGKCEENKIKRKHKGKKNQRKIENTVKNQ